MWIKNARAFCPGCSGRRRRLGLDPVAEAWKRAGQKDVGSQGRAQKGLLSEGLKSGWMAGEAMGLGRVSGYAGGTRSVCLRPQQHNSLL